MSKDTQASVRKVLSTKNFELEVIKCVSCYFGARHGDPAKRYG